MSGFGPTPNERVDVAARRARALKLRSRGWTYEMIAEELGLADRAAAYTDIKRAVESATKEMHVSAREYLHMELEHLDELRRAAQNVLEARHVKINDGVPVYINEDGQVKIVIDDAPVLHAVATLLKVAERKAKLLGLDAPVKQQIEQDTKVVTIQVEGIDPEKLR